MFGMMKKRGGLFGATNGLVATPEQEAESARMAAYFRNKGFDVGDTQDEPVAPPSAVSGSFGIGGTMNPEAQPEPRKGGLFARGGIGRSIAGTIGDVLLQRGGLKPMYAPAMKAQHEALLAQQERENALADYESKKKIDQRYAAPGDNIDLREDNAGNVWQFDKRTGQPIGAKPVWVDQTPKEFVHEGMRFSIPNPYLSGGAAPSGNVPTVSDEATYNAVPPGGQYRDPQGNLRTKGGPTPQASGTFQQAFGSGL